MPVLTMFVPAILVWSSAICWSVWLCMGARNLTDKILATGFPITAFVVCGFEHSIANRYFLPIGRALAVGSAAPLSVSGAFNNLMLVTFSAGPSSLRRSIGRCI